MSCDLKISYQGNFVIENGDLAMASGSDFIARAIGLRVRTPLKNTYWPGCSITSFIGKLDQTAGVREMQSVVRQALVKDGLLESASVVAEPMGEAGIKVTIQALTGEDTVTKRIFYIENGVVETIDDLDISEIISTDTSQARPVINKYLRRNR
jgi:hypothetical protein